MAVAVVVDGSRLSKERDREIHIYMYKEKGREKGAKQMEVSVVSSLLVSYTETIACASF